MHRSWIVVVAVHALVSTGAPRPGRRPRPLRAQQGGLPRQTGLEDCEEQPRRSRRPSRPSATCSWALHGTAL